MSTKIYGGYILPSMDTFELRNFCNRVGTQIRNRSREMLAEQVAKVSSYIVDRNTAGLDVSGFTDKMPLISPFASAYFFIDGRQREVKKTGGRDPEYDYMSSLAILPVEEGLPCILYAEKGDFRRIWEAQREVKPFPYWDNTDRPENITEREWEERGRIWERALGETTIPALEGLVAEFTNGVLLFPRLEEVLRYVPTFGQRSESIASDIVAGKKRKKIESGSYADILMEINRYLGSDDGRNAIEAEKKGLAGILKPVLTFQDLSQEVMK